jgi:hypothetical protein
MKLIGTYVIEKRASSLGGWRATITARGLASKAANGATPGDAFDNALDRLALSQLLEPEDEAEGMGG